MQHEHTLPASAAQTHGHSASHQHLLRMVQMAMLAAISIALVLMLRVPIFPAAPFLEYDMADVPVLLGAFTLGPAAGLTVLFVVSAIQAFLLGGNGIIGLIMHFVASGAMVLVAALVYRAGGKNTISLILGLVLGALTRVALMIPLNLVFIPILFGAPREYVLSLVVPVIIPFNLIVGGLNCSIFFLLFKSLRFFLERRKA